MSMTVRIDGDKAIIAKLDKALAAVADPQAPLRDIGDFLIDEFKLNFATEGTRTGGKWQELSRATMIQKMAMGYGGKGILERTGKLKNAFEKAVSRFTVRVSNPTAYYRYHQLGEGYNPKRVMIAKTDLIRGQIFQIINEFIKKTIA